MPSSPTPSSAADPTVLYRGLRSLMEAPDVPALYATLLDLGLELLGSNAGFAASVDRERDRLALVARRNVGGTGSLPLDWPPAAHTLRAGEVSDEPHEAQSAALFQLEFPAEELLLTLVPIGAQGLLCLSRDRGSPAEPEHRLALRELASAAGLLASRGLRSAEREEELSLLWDVKRHMADTEHDLDEANLSALLAKLLQIALRRTGTQNGGIFLLDEETGDVLVEHQAIRGDHMGHVPDRLRQRKGDRKGGILFWVLEHNAAYRTGDVTQDPYYLPFFQSIRSNLTVPITFQDRAIGAIVVESVAPDFFQDRDLEALTDLARSATMFIRRAQLYRQTREGGGAGILIKGAGSDWVEVERRIERAAATDATVLLRGESGTGKELCAHSIHFNSRRAKKPFVVVNAGAIPEALLESELFGHVRGAFTGAGRDKLGQFELADGGTIFLDELGELPPSLQVKLLRTLQSGDIHKVGSLQVQQQVDVRVIAATSRDLEAMMQRGAFRPDLYFRVNVVPIWLPPLRRYKDSIPGIVRALLTELARRHRRDVAGVSTEAMELLLAYDWPGNVRELRNAIEQALVLEETSVIRPASIPADLRAAAERQMLLAASPHRRSAADSTPRGPDSGQAGYHGAREECLRQFERTYVERLMARAGGNVTRAASAAGLSRVNLYRLLRRHGLHPSERGQDRD